MSILSIRKILLRHAALPRPQLLKVRSLSDRQNVHGRYNILYYEHAPYYIRPSWLERWSLQAWMVWARGRPLPGDEGEKYHPKGYKIMELGPKAALGRSAQSTDEVQRLLFKGACPFRA